MNIFISVIIIVSITLERVSRRDRSGPLSASDEDGYDCATELVPLTIHKHLHKRTRGGEGFTGSVI